MPEATQASALDCGPAALAALLGGCGLARSFEELRERCRTGRDGTSVDALEEVAIEQGLDAEQVLVPVDYPTLAAAACVPCILVVALPSGATHFVTLWRLHGRRAQVMDPAAGRRWPSLRDLERDIYRHRMVVPAAAWRAWAASEGALLPLAARLAELGISGTEREALIGGAASDDGWLALAGLDAAIRFVRQLVAAGGLRRGADAGGLLRVMLDRALEPAGRGQGIVLPTTCWSARPAAPGVDGGERVVCEGAVLVRVRGYRSAEASGVRRARSGGTARRAAAWRRGGGRLARAASPEGSAAAAGSETTAGGTGADRLAGANGGNSSGGAVDRGRSGTAADREHLGAATGRERIQDAADRERRRGGEPPGCETGHVCSGQRRGIPGGGTGVALALASVGAACCRFAEAALLVAALEILGAAPSRGVRAVVLAALLVLGAAVLLFELAAAGAAQSLGRRRETVLRLRLAAKLPRLPDRYLRTRLLADLAERAHRLADLRRGPELAAATMGCGLDLLLATAGIVWLDPGLAAGAIAAGAGALAVPLLLLPRYEERSRRVRTHGGALAALYLDVLRGRAAIRTHGAASAFRRRHEELLGGWLRARRAAEAAGSWLEAGVQGLLSLVAAGLVLGHVRRHGLDPQSLVLALWAFQAAAAGQRLALLAGRGLPLDRSLRRRIEEPLAAAEEPGIAEGRTEREPRAPAVVEDAALELAGMQEGCGAECSREAPGSAAAVAECGRREAAGRSGGAAVVTLAGGGARGDGVESPRARAGALGRERDGRWGAKPALAATGGQPSAGMALTWEGCTVECDGRPLLRDLDLAIAAGEHVAVLGSSGAGKSTLLGTVLGWQRPAAGCLWVDGRRFEGAVAAEVRRATAWAAPEVALWRGSLLANLAGVEDGRLPPEESSGGAGWREEAALAPAEALRAAELLELVPQLARGLQEPLGEAGGRLSGGEGQRLRFARALRRPGVRLALLDEPFRGLGPDQRRELLAAARARWRRATLLCVTHSPGEAAGFDRVVILEQGRLVEEGRPEVMAARHGSYYGAMLDAEARAAAALGGSGWRRLHLAGGRLVETQGAERQADAEQPLLRLAAPGESACSEATAAGTLRGAAGMRE
ncbi:MAG TPA: ATP-binding cassette domain-containing protein [Thermoanaerobaculia bacterium]|nr:ATP-binding cassette domain-containing protein [Thermoanaerobaculia bacterium]